MHVCLLGPGTRRRYAICVYALRVPLPGYLCVLTHATPRLATWHHMVTYLRSWWRCVACLLFVCMRRHTFCPLSLPFASYISGRAGGRWARLGYASWSPFTFVGVVAVLVSCPLRSVAWHATYLDPTSHVCMFGFCSFFFFFFVLCFTSVVFLFLLACPFIPCRSSVAVMALRRSGHARVGIPFFPYVSGGEHRHSFGATSCWFSLPVRFSLRFSWRRTLALLDTLLVLRLVRRYAHNIWHITYLLSGGRWRCCCLCVFFMHDMQHTWVHVRPLFLFVVIPFACYGVVVFPT